MRSRRTSAVVALLVVLAGACSDDTSTDDATATSPSREATTDDGAASAAADADDVGSPTPPDAGTDDEGAATDVTPTEAVTSVDADGTRRVVGAAYGDDPAQRLDVTVPPGPGPHPLLVWIHGGGWVVGDRTDSPLVDLVERGVAVASMDHRTALTVHPATFEDPVLAVRWLQDHADELGVDADRVAVAGFSSGGHLAALTGLGDEVDVVAVLSFAGVLDLRDLSAVPEAGDGLGPAALVALLLDCPPAECPDRVAAASPVTLLDPDDPPVFVQQGTEDRVVDPSVATSFAAVAEAEDADVTLDLVEGMRHRIRRTPALTAFLDTHLVP